MKMRDFIRDNRKELDIKIAQIMGLESNPNPNDEERELWIINIEELYRWARSEGVKT